MVVTSGTAPKMRKARKPEPDLGRLTQAMRDARLALKRFREGRREAVRQYVGRHWSDEGTAESVPVNLIAQYVNIVGRNLISKDPRVLLSTFDQQAKGRVATMERWANKEVVDTHLAETLGRVVLDALFSVGITKVALATPADSAGVSWNLAAGQPFCERVDLDDFVFDVHARDFAECGFIGHRYRVPLEVANDLYSRRLGRKLEASEDRYYNPEGDERIGVLGRTYYGTQSQEYREHVDLWEVYLPGDRRVVTLLDDHLLGADASDPKLRPLWEQEWLGPDEGPYHVLGYMTVPGNAMPKGPIQDLLDLHEAVNNIYRKLIRQCERQKEVLPVRRGSTSSDDGQRLIATSDGEAFACDGDPPEPVSYGGPNAGLFQMVQHLKDLFSWLAGNLDAIGGLSPQARTATQDKMLEANASQGVSSLQDVTVGYTARVVKALAWYWWHHPEKVMRVEHALPGLPGISAVRELTPQDRRQTRWADLDLKIDPYSLQRKTPQLISQMLDAVVQQTAPMMQLLQQQGVTFDVQAYLRKKGKYLDLPDLPEIFTYQEPPPQDSAAGGDGGGVGMPANTTRTYERRSVGQDGAQAKAAQGAKMMGPEQMSQPMG